MGVLNVMSSIKGESSKLGKSGNWYSAQLDTRNCLNLGQILRVFSAPITEEHAWAVTFQCLSCLMKRLQNEDAICYSVETANDIFIHTSGSIHEDTFSHKQQERKVITAENAAVADCGAAIYDLWIMDLRPISREPCLLTSKKWLTI